MLSRRVRYWQLSVCLVVLAVAVLLGGIFNATAMSDEDRLPSRLKLELSNEPRLGEVVQATFTVTSLVSVPQMKVIWGSPLQGVEIVGGVSEVYCDMAENETRVFIIEVRFVSSPVHFGAKVGRWWYATELEQIRYGLSEGEERFGLSASASLRRVVIDEETGQFGPPGQKLSMEPEYRYDMESGTIYPIGEYQGSGPYAREMIEQLKDLEPELTDWEAVYLHRDALKAFFRGVGGNRIEWLLREGWLMKSRGGEKQKDRWLEELIRQRLLDQEGSENRDGTMYPPATEQRLTTGPQLTETGFLGRFKFKKHKYDTTGLLTEAVDTPIRKARVRIWATWLGQGKKMLEPVGLTDNNGDFSITTTDIPHDAQSVSALPVVYMWGPSLSGLDTSRIRVSDPSPQAGGYADTLDETVWWLRESDNAPTDPVSPGSTYDFGVVFVETLWAWGGIKTQPRSGAANIYDALLRAYEHLILDSFTTADTISKVRALWEPAYICTTQYYGDSVPNNPDTIWIRGDTSTLFNDTDEWDDSRIVHEYGHHAHYQCSEWGPGRTKDYKWYTTDSVTSDAWPEGWANFFSSVVTESIYIINTKGGIGGNDKAFKSIEDPWQGSYFSPDSFEGTDSCIGAVAGVLWDIYDLFQETPYDSYPLPPDWPDTGLADTLQLGFDEIWNVFDDWPHPLPYHDNCWNIREFAEGWLSPEYSHNHIGGLQQVYTHHRMKWGYGPGNPRNHTGKVNSKEPWIILSYDPPDTSGGLPEADGYRIYRKFPSDSLFSMLGEDDTTSYVDSTVIANYTYVYTVTAYDSFGYEGDTSNNVTLWVPGSDDSLATARNNAQKIVWNQGDSTVYIAFSSGGNVCCEQSTDFGGTWSVDTIGQGAYPTIALAPSGRPWMVWLGNSGGFGPFNNAWKSILCRNLMVTDTWSQVDTIWTYSDSGSASDSLQCVSFSTDSVLPIAYGHIACTYVARDSIGGQPGVVIDARLDYFRFQLGDSAATGITRQQVASSSWGAPPPHIGLASVAADTIGFPHIAWEEYLSWKTNSPHAILYTRGTEILLDTVQWAMPEDTLSDTTKTSYHPSIVFDTLNNRTSVAWEAFKTADSDYQICTRFRTSSWDTIKDIPDTLGSSRLPVISGDYVVWSEWDGSGVAQLFRSRYDAFGTGAWGDPEAFFVSGEPSLYPHTVWVTADSFLMTCWTEGNSSPYSVAFDLGQDSTSGGGGMPSFYVDAGRQVASEHLIHRTGYQQWGDLPELTADTDPRLVSYSFVGLDPKVSYELRTVHYFESSRRALVGSRTTSKEIGSTDGSSRTLTHAGHVEPQGRSAGEAPSFPKNLAAESESGVAPVGSQITTRDARIFEAKTSEVAPEVSKFWTMRIGLDGQNAGTVDLPAKSGHFSATFRKHWLRTGH